MTAIGPDYDTNPSRFFAWRPLEDVHRLIADRIAAEGLRPVLDIGCGDGRLLAAAGSTSSWIGLDRSTTMLARAPGCVVRGEADRLPIASGAIGAAAALWMLYHLPDPGTAIAEAHRVLRRGGLFVASASRRDDSPELGGPSAPTTFDAEQAADLLGRVFGDRHVEVVSWDAPLVELTTRDDARRYLLQQLRDPTGAGDVEVPRRVTKRGCVVWARRA